VPLANTQVLLRALQYASTFGYTVWLRPQDR
jgi:dihydroorotase